MAQGEGAAKFAAFFHNPTTETRNMRYLGGKSRIGKQIAAFINPLLVDGAPYYEPFCGACWVTQHIVAPGGRFCSDAHGPLIALWQSLQRGWVPPDTVSEAEYRAAKAGEASPELRAFIGFGCSFGGKWFGGIARDTRGGGSAPHARAAKNSLLKKIQTLRDVVFSHTDYLNTSPSKDSVVYCDPPYKGTTHYSGLPEWDSTTFWNTIRHWSSYATVLVSEYVAPADFECVAEYITKTELRTKKGRVSRYERLFRYRQP
jgi:DNA adenine methylase